MYRFKSILKQTLWGGEKIKQLKHIPDAPSQIGESWELSAVEGNVSTIDGGSEDGVLLTDVIDRDKERLMGRRNYERFGHRFPLLIKFIDAKQDLSIQVHPNDEIAHRQGLPCGKTEMWYLMPSEDDAVIRVGLKKKITPEEYKQMVANNTITDAIAHYNVKAGDCFFLPGGRIHSIGAGCMLVEIQQTSDCTYRIYDFNRRDKNGNLRELHTEKAAECINYEVLPDYRTKYEPHKNQPVLLVDSPVFTTSVLDMDSPVTLDWSAIDSFQILICLSGEGEVAEDDGEWQPMRAGQTYLFPATTAKVRLKGKMQLINTYVK